MKNMKKNILLGAFLATFATISAAGNTPQALLDYFDGNDVSYIVRNAGETTRVVTWNHKEAKATCADLAAAGIRVSNVTNFAPNGEEYPIISISNCK